MYSNSIQVIFLIFFLKLEFTFSSIILDRNKLSSSDSQNLKNSELREIINKTSFDNLSPINSSFNNFSISSPLANLTSSNNDLTTTELNESLNFSPNSLKNNQSIIENHQLKTTDYINQQKNLIDSLVKEENLIDKNKFKNEINLTDFNSEKPSTNSVIDEELINEFKLMNNKSKNLEDNLVIEEKIETKIDEKDNLEILQTINETLILTNKDDDDVYNLRIESDTQDCMFVRSVDGVYTFNSDKNYTDVCGLYSIAEPNQIIEYEFEHFNVSCGEFNNEYPKDNQSLVTIVDGWELNGQFFPGLQDHLKKTERYKEICINNSQTDSTYVKQIFRVSQNVGLIQFRILNMFEGFKVRVRFINNPQPCNVLLRLPTGVYTLRNYGQPINCSISILFPESFTIISNSIVNKQLMIEDEVNKKSSDYYDYQFNKNQSEINSNDQNSENKNANENSQDDCINKADSDYIELKGGDGLDTDLMLLADKMCLVKDLRRKKIDIDCGNTAVRLVSSGLYDNSVTLAFDLLEPASTDFKCPQKPGFKG